ncbi:MAG TPA: L-histidine N(alpha)-methyltransferase [Deltaproteobacteria bacterium]|nr:L-histidine N(alpha)-methyltransferase [Deltaproteobacteria bacterium]
MPLHDLHPAPDDLSAEVLSGLRAEPRTLPCKYFYDAEGSKLFDRICELEEYYPTRTEIGILSDQATAIADSVGGEALVIELGSGSSTKTHRLLEALTKPAGYVPVDISRAHLTEAAARIARSFPGLPVWPVCADFNQELDLPALESSGARRLIFFPGSTIGNFDRPARAALLRRSANLCGAKGGRMLIGIDLIKDVDRLERAYDDRDGVTAAFNRNLLRRINRELGADFVPERFAHEATFDPVEARIEMHLVSEVDQSVAIGDQRFRFERGERICTEHSYKFTIGGFVEGAAEAGWALEHAFTDAEELFALLLLQTT